MDSYQNKHNRHSVYIERLATHLFNEHITTSLDAAYKAARLVLLDNDTITSLSKLNRVTSSVRTAINEILASGWSDTTAQLEETAIYEAEFYANIFNESNDVNLVVPDDKKIISAVTNSLMTLTSGQSVTSDAWINYTKANASKTMDIYTAQIRAGFSNDETLNQVTKRLKTVTEGLLKRNAEALVRTGMSHYASTSRNALMNANKELVPNKYYNAVFDNRTTLICRGFGGQTWVIDDKSAPNIPAHINCRSNWLYLVEGQTEPFGTRSSVGGAGTKEAQERYEKRKNALSKRRANENITGETSSKVKYRGRKDTDTFTPGQISGKTSMDSWLISQPEWFIKSSLGAKRAELFISGKVKLSGFTDMVGKPLSLAQLKASGV